MRPLIATGANGYIGRAVLAAATGFEIYALARHDTFAETINYIPYDLTRPLPADLPQDAIIIHLAYTPRTDASQMDRNQIALRRWIEFAKNNNGRLIFISSQTARADAPTLYGYDKWCAERDVLAADGIAVRPGMVYGGAPAGLYGLMKKLVKLLPILPDFRPAPQVQPVHVDDLAAALIQIAKSESDQKSYNIGSSAPVSFTEFLKQIARDAGRKRYFLPVPARLLQACFGIAKRLPAGLRTRIQSLQSLFDLPAMQADDFNLRPFITADDALAVEAKAIFNHLCGDVRPHWVEQYRTLFHEPASIKDRTRNLAALEIAQSDPDAAALFHDTTFAQRMRSFIALPFALLREIWFKITRRG